MALSCAPQSSNITFIMWMNSELHVTFKNGSTYQYLEVSRRVFDEMAAAESVGKYLNAHVKGTYQYRKQGEPPMPKATAICPCKEYSFEVEYHLCDQGKTMDRRCPKCGELSIIQLGEKKEDPMTFTDQDA